MPIFTEAELTQICLNMLQSVGVLETEAEIVTKSMIDANLVGHDSHGIIHLPKYIQGIMDASIRLDAKVEIDQESPSTAVLNGNWGLGPVIAKYAMELAVQKAEQTDALPQREPSPLASHIAEWRAFPTLCSPQRTSLLRADGQPAARLS